MVMRSQMPGASNWPYMQPAFESLVTQTLNMQRPMAQKFYLLVLFDDQWPQQEEYDDVGKLVGRLKDLLGKPCCVFAYLGHAMPITEGEHKFLQTPTGPIPLFAIPDANTAPAAKFGWLGGDLEKPEPPDSEVLEAAEDDTGEAEEEADTDGIADEPPTDECSDFVGTSEVI